MNTKRFAFLAPLSLLLPLLVACGGSTTRIGPGSGTDAGDDGPNGCPPPSVVGSIVGGATCSDIGQTCPGTVSISSCGGPATSTTVECSCQSGTWACPIAVSGGCPVPDPGCPSPASITEGGSCDTSPGDTCTSNIPIPSCTGQPEGYVQCSCQQGTWSCEEFGGPACAIDSGTCPDPGQVFNGGGCDTYGTTCQGDAQICGTTTVYDTLQCYAGAWTIVASTVCDINEPDAGVFLDGGMGI